MVDGDSLLIYQSEKLILTDVSRMITLGIEQINDPFVENHQPQLSDINSNGYPELIFQRYTGGAHCCAELNILEFNYSETKMIYNGRSVDGSYFFKKYKDDWIFGYSDGSFLYWKTDYASSADFTVYKKWDKKSNDFRYVYPQDSMAAEFKFDSNIKIDSYRSNIHSFIDQTLHDEHWCSYYDTYSQSNTFLLSRLSDYWYSIIFLLEHDEYELAKQFSKLAWNDTEKERIKFMKELLDQLSKSPDYNYMLTLHPNIRSLIR